MINDQVTNHTLLSHKTRSFNRDDNMIPMINIIFLLLIFYIVAGQIKASKQQDVIIPSASVLNQNKVLNPTNNIISVSELGELYWNQSLITAEKLKQEITLLESQSLVYIYADRNLLADKLDTVLNMLRIEGNTRIHLMVRNQSEAQTHSQSKYSYQYE